LYYGGIISVLSSKKQDANEIAEKLGKLHEEGKIRIYYRRNGDFIRSVLVPSEYPEKILDAAEAVSLSSYCILHIPEDIKWVDGEEALLIDALGLPGKIVTNLPSDNIKKIFKGLTIEKFEIIKDIQEIENKENEKGFVYIDRAFVVKGVGVVITGFSFTQVKVHDKLKILPQGKEVEIKSIQVLDEDQTEVMPGIRIGFALRNVKEEELKDSFALVKSNSKLLKEFTAKITVYPWSKFTDGKYHVVSNGISVVAEIKRQENEALVSLPFEVPISQRIAIIDVNAKQGKSRVIGYLEPK